MIFMYLGLLYFLQLGVTFVHLRFGAWLVVCNCLLLLETELTPRSDIQTLFYSCHFSLLFEVGSVSLGEKVMSRNENLMTVIWSIKCDQTLTVPMKQILTFKSE